MNYQEEEDRIVNQLTAKFAAYSLAKNIGSGVIEIAPLPEVDEDFDKAFGKRKLFVAFAGEEAANELKSLSAVSQEVNAMFSVLIRSKTLRDVGVTPGIYTLVALVKKYLVGFSMLSGQPLVYVDTKPEARTSGTFDYVVSFSSKHDCIQDIEEEEQDLGGLLKKVIYQP